MKIYIDNDFHCHTANPDNVFREFDVPRFDGKCEAFVEGYMYIPDGESWARDDGVLFEGPIITPWKPCDELDELQREYELQLLAEYEATIDELIGGVNDVQHG